MNPFQIRLARQTDLTGIFLVEDDSFSKPYPHDLIAKLLRDWPNSFLVAEHQPGKIIGYCVAAEEGKSAHLISIGVIQEYRRRGIGTALIRRLLANLSSGVKELRLEVKENNREAITFYEAIGFKQVDYAQNYYEDGSAAIQMHLTMHEANGGSSRSGAK